MEWCIVLLYTYSSNNAFSASWLFSTYGVIVVTIFLSFLMSTCTNLQANLPLISIDVLLIGSFFVFLQLFCKTLFPSPIVSLLYKADFLQELLRWKEKSSKMWLKNASAVVLVNRFLVGWNNHGKSGKICDHYQILMISLGWFQCQKV